MSVDSKKVNEILQKISEKINENKAYLTELDATIGDGDHGLNMSRGFNAVILKLKDETSDDIGIILKNAGMALVSNVGGAAGPLYGTAFIKAGAAVTRKNEIDISDFVIMLKAALAGVKMRGKSDKGDKTMIDAIEPALDALENSISEGNSNIVSLKSLRDAAYAGVEATKKIIAKKGRASYLGERSIGHQDPGATSSAIIFDTIYQTLR